MSVKFYGDGRVYAESIKIEGEEIIEYDSNSNGSYVRYIDGTQICWRDVGPEDLTSVSVFDDMGGEGWFWDIRGRASGSSETWRTSSGEYIAFPASFSSPAVAVDGGYFESRGASFDAWPVAGVHHTTNRTTHWTVALMAGYSNIWVNQVRFSVFAIGRWYEL